MDELTPEMAQILHSKEERRKRLAALSYPEKVAIVVRLQQIAAPLRRARGLPGKPWELAADDPAFPFLEALCNPEHDVGRR